VLGALGAVIARSSDEAIQFSSLLLVLRFARNDEQRSSPFEARKRSHLRVTAL
jgi:hypothetical protein